MEFLVPRFEVQIVHGARQMLWGLQLAFYECLVDHNLRGDIGESTPLPQLNLLTHRPEIPLHSVNTDRNAVDQRERLRVLGENGRKDT
ncbi:MAG: hypothetical protein WCB11_03120 [Terriglobales bacterium]